ncbi:NAD(P)-binding protein [Wolfiporia cocos MD-104 SS10]|uniref:NAD(P)-binding protein n=1 Tax=Wolfiporia cocos (strain MD-104) TaxID=742152 RepID=A0A2H3JH27_WOLCO|nr:NAD(P)-binding protein [Wolfiporia cocos MD-104 SS10]
MSSPESYTWLITGANRGIGLELTRQLLASAAPTHTVIAACRTPDAASDLHALQHDTSGAVKGAVHVVALDVSSEASIRACVPAVQAILGERGLDYLYNNAAVNPTDDSPFDFSYPELLDILQINVGAPALLTQLCLPLIERGRRKVIVNATSGLASIGLDIGAKCTSYSVSKTALNMLTYKQARARPDFIAIVLDPGWVKTAMGGPGAVLEPAESVSGILSVVTRLTTADSGKFFRYNGTQHPW